MNTRMNKVSDTSGPTRRCGALLLSGLLAFSTAWAQPPSFATDPTELARLALRDERGSVSVGVLHAGQARFAFLQNDGGVTPPNGDAADAVDATARAARQAHLLPLRHHRWMMAPDTRKAVVVLTSSAHAQPGRVFTALAASRYPVALSPVTLDAALLGTYAGVYQVDRNMAFTFVQQNGNLYRRAIGGGYRPLRPAGNDTFIDTDVGAVYVFAHENGALARVDITQGGGRLRATRTDKAAPTMAVVAPDLEADYTGRYHLGRTLRRNLDFDVKVEGGQLGVRSSNWERRPVFPMADRPDRFAYENARSQLQFERDADGKVVALVLYEGGEFRMRRSAD